MNVMNSVIEIYTFHGLVYMTFTSNKVIYFYKHNVVDSHINNLSMEKHALYHFRILHIVFINDLQYIFIYINADNCNQFN